MNKAKLIFVYNAKSGLVSGAFDLAHKIVSPQTYACNLCMVTYGNLGMKGGWKKYLDTIDMDKVFLHTDQLIGDYIEIANHSLPAVFYQDSNQNIQPLISSEEMNKLENLDELMSVLDQKLGNLKLT